MKTRKYIFSSKRLGFRNWTINDLKEFSEINADPSVMEHFPNTLSKKDTERFIERLRSMYNDKGYTYFATEILKTGELIGFIGLAHQTYIAKFTPATDIGWRLKKTAWGKGYATEGAKKCLAYAFTELKLNKIIAICTINNEKSEKVMKKIGMTKQGSFKHPNLTEFPEHEQCVWYEIKNKNSLPTSKQHP